LDRIKKLLCSDVNLKAQKYRRLSESCSSQKVFPNLSKVKELHGQKAHEKLRYYLSPHIPRFDLGY